MARTLLSPLWLLIMILGLPTLSDTFTAAMPKIAKGLNAPVVMIEYAFTVYLAGFALGMLFWGELADKLSRKLCMLAGLTVFIFSCIGCYSASTVELLMIWRFGQAFGASSCYVLGHAECRSTFHGRTLGKAYASIESTLAIVPIFGSFFGSVIQSFSWRALFLFLSALACALTLTIALYLPNTSTVTEFTRRGSVLGVSRRMFKDKKIIGYGLIIACCLGIYYSYYVEGLTYLVHILGLSSNQFDFSFVAISAAYIAGGIISRRLHESQSSNEIMCRGMMILALASFVFSGLTVLHVIFIIFPAWMLAMIAILSQACIMFGSGMTISNALTLALADYHWCTGASSSIFGFFYYALVSGVTLGMSFLHNGTLLPMPLYFLGLSALMLIVMKTMIRDS